MDQSGPILNNSALIADSSTNDFGELILNCHSSRREERAGRWISPRGEDITYNHGDDFRIEQQSGMYPSYITLQLITGEELAFGDQGVYTCLVPDENGEEQALHVGIYRSDYEGKIGRGNFGNRVTSERWTSESC